MLRCHSEGCVEVDILASVSVCVCRKLSATADIHGRGTNSNVLVLSWSKKLQFERNE